MHTSPGGDPETKPWLGSTALRRMWGTPEARRTTDLFLRHNRQSLNHACRPGSVHGAAHPALNLKQHLQQAQARGLGRRLAGMIQTIPILLFFGSELLQELWPHCCR